MTVLGNIPVDSDLQGGNHIIPAGMIAYWPKVASPPTGWLQCYGQAISRTTYADLFTALGTAYGSGDGSTTFNVPDCRGRVLVGAHSMNNAEPSLTRMTSNNTRGAVGGTQSHSLTVSQMPSHAHTGGTTSIWHEHLIGHGAYYVNPAYSDSALVGFADVGLAQVGLYYANIDHTHNIPANGSSTAHNNLQPYTTLTQIVKA